MNNKILIPILIIAVVVVVIIIVTLALTKEEQVTNTAVTNTISDPLQAEETTLDSLLNTINAQNSDEALIPEVESTLNDLESDSTSVSTDQALDDATITSEEKVLTDLETTISTSQSDKSTVNETTNTLLDTMQ